jgi:hypothetical protein
MKVFIKEGWDPYAMDVKKESDVLTLRKLCGEVVLLDEGIACLVQKIVEVQLNPRGLHLCNTIITKNQHLLSYLPMHYPHLKIGYALNN